MKYNVEILESLTQSDYRDILELMKELSGPNKDISFDNVVCTIKDGYLFVARNENGSIDAMMTLVYYDALSGRKCWIEDVIVAERCRGCGISRMILNKAIEFAKKQGCCSINLTSRPSRKIAHELYMSCGFVVRDTDVMILVLDK